MNEPKKVPTIKPGDVVYFHTVKEEPRRNAKDIRFVNGIYGFGLILGAHAPGMVPLTAEIFMTLMGQIGFLSYDNVNEFLGEEQMKICLTKFAEKYHPKELPLAPPESKLVLPVSTETLTEVEKIGQGGTGGPAGGFGDLNGTTLIEGFSNE